MDLTRIPFILILWDCDIVGTWGSTNIDNVSPILWFGCPFLQLPQSSQKSGGVVRKKPDFALNTTLGQ